MPAYEHICVVIGRTRHKMIQAELREAGRQGARLIELRLDFLAKAPDFKRLLAHKPCPVIATVRRIGDGGRWGSSEEARQMLLRQAIVAGFDWVDLEMDVVEEIQRFKNVKRIVSYHNMREVPADLEKIYDYMARQDVDVIKVAVRAQNPEDNLRVLEIQKRATKPTVAFCMGDMGLPSRLLAGKFGAPFTYAAFTKERTLAPGLPSFDDLKKIYHYEDVNADTEVYGVVGDPVAHSQSPLLHNNAFRHIGKNAVYLPFRVPRGELAEFLKAIEPLKVKGFSITIPHKEAAAEAAGFKDPAVNQIQAANTLVRGPEGYTAYNTDYDGVLDSLYANLPPTWAAMAGLRDSAPSTGITELPSFKDAQSVLASRTVLVLGAGGVARAVAMALHRERALVTIANRNFERGQRLATEIGCRVVEWQNRQTVTCDILVNCTSVGMHPNLDQTPIDSNFLRPNLLVLDAVYTPETTLLVKEARLRGCHVITGTDLFVRQAARQFQLFTGQPAPVELMRDLLRRALSPVKIHDEAEELARQKVVEDQETMLGGPE